MTRTLPALSSLTPAKSLSPSLADVRTHPAKAVIEADRAEHAARINAKREVLSLIRVAMKQSGMSQKEFAINAGIAESTLADGFNGIRTFGVDWLWHQPGAFWTNLRDAIDEAKGFTTLSQAQLQGERISELLKLLLVEKSDLRIANSLDGTHILIWLEPKR